MENHCENLLILYRTQNFFLCREGFYYHFTNAFTIKKFLIMSGFMHKKNIFYNNNNNIFDYKTENLKCYPCYKLYECESCKENLKLIKPEDIVKIIKSNI